MRTRKILFLCGVLFSSGAFAALSLTWGQEAPPGSASKPATSSVPLAIPAPVERAPRDLARLSALQRQMYLSAQSGADWLRRANRADGRFLAGYVPALKTPLEGDHYLRQAAAAFALARAAAFFGRPTADCHRSPGRSHAASRYRDGRDRATSAAYLLALRCRESAGVRRSARAGHQ
jgi:hypothetical protein